MEDFFSVKYISELFKYNIWVEASKYFIVGGVCTILDFSLLYVLTTFLGINYLVSSIISFLAGTILNYFLCTSWIFKINVIKKRYREFFFYILIAGIGLIINTGIIWSLTRLFELYFMVSKLVAVIVVFGWNFGARKYFLHTKK